MKEKICLIAPYKDLLFFTENNSMNGYDNLIIKKYASLSEVLDIGKKFQEQGGEIIITRGGSAKILKENTSLFVVDIEISSYEIIKTLQKIENKESPLGIVGYKNAVYKCAYLAKILGFKETYEIMYDQKVSYDEYIRDLEELIYNKKITNFIGDTVLLNTLEKKRYYIDFYLIKSEANSIYRAYEKAVKFLEYRKKEEDKNLYLNLIVSNVDCGLILTSINGDLKEVNKIAENILRLKIKETKSIFYFFPELENLIKNAKKEKLLEINKEQILVTFSLIEIESEKYYLFIFRKLTNIEKLAKAPLENKKESKYTWNDIITNDKNFKEIIEIAKIYSQTDENILITGESGTGKELFAQSIHNDSYRKNFPFVAFNCANIAESLIESELFGYEEGAFTGANKKGKKGLFELADKGTIFLDEISEIPYYLQSKFLRVLEEKSFRRVGGEENIHINIRVIAASNKDLRKMVAEEKFRKDLYYRLNVLEIKTIPLRERKNDVLFISNFLLKKELLNYSGYFIEDFKNILKEISKFNFYGNVRELKNILKRIVILKIILKLPDNKILEQFKVNENLKVNTEFSNMTLYEMERNIILKTLEEENGNKAKTAIRLGIDRGKINRILNKIQ